MYYGIRHTNIPVHQPRWVAGFCAGICVLFALMGCVALEERVPGESLPASEPSTIEYPGKYDGSLFFWELTRQNTTLYILGSIHLANEDVYPLDEAIIRAFERSDLLIEEVDIINADTLAAQNYVMANSALPSGQTLTDYLTAENEQRLIEILTDLEIPYERVQTMQPWVIENTLVLLRSADADMDEEHGIDLYFAAEAYKAGKETYGLETMVGQLSMLNSISMESQVYILEEAIREYDNLDAELSELLEIWKKGDVTKMEEVLLSSFNESDAGREYYQSLLIQRNRDWFAQIVDLSEEGTAPTMFIVVGAGHLVGADNLIEMLVLEGFDARRY